MDLLNTQDRDDIFLAFADLFDTFFQYQALIRKRTRKIAAFDDERSDAFSVVDYPIRCLPVPDANGEDAHAMLMQIGAIDMSEGVVYISWADAKDSGLVDALNIFIIPNQDSVILAGIDYDVIGVNQSGPLKNNAGDGYALLKIHVKKKLKNHG